MIRLAMALQRLPFLSSSEQVQLLDVFSSAEDLHRVTARDLLFILGRPWRGQGFSAEDVIEQVDQDRERFQVMGIRAVHLWSCDYPALLREFDDPPAVLYVRGRMPEHPCISVVGTRRPTTEGRHAAYRTGYEMARLGYTVISGLALGIDAEAHCGAVDGSGQSVAVLGSGIDCITPRTNSHLAARMMEQNGGVMSEFPPGVLAEKRHFPQRNRIIAGLSALTVVVEAPRGSGAMITADYAAESREVMVHQVGYRSPLGDGCRELVYSGARVLHAAAQQLPPAADREGVHE